MSAERMIAVRLYDPQDGAEWNGQLPASTRIGALTALLNEQGVKPFQRVGYGYIAEGHLCSELFSLADYLPQEADSIALRIFAYPQVLQG